MDGSKALNPDPHEKHPTDSNMVEREVNTGNRLFQFQDWYERKCLLPDRSTMSASVRVLDMHRPWREFLREIAGYIEFLFRLCHSCHDIARSWVFLKIYSG